IGIRRPDAILCTYGTVEMQVTNPDKGTPILTGDDCEWFWDMYTADPQDRALAICNPARGVDLSNIGPSLFLTAEYDPTRDATEDYAKRLKDAGNDATLFRYDGVMHGFATMLGILPEADNSLCRITEFFKTKL